MIFLFNFFISLLCKKTELKVFIIIFLILVMKSYQEIPPSIDELHQWNENKLINPRTNRKISTKSKIYKCLEKSHMTLNTRSYTWIDCHDNIEPITLDVIWTLKDKVKIKGTINDEEMIYYLDESEIVRGIKITSLIQMKKYNFIKHPITNKVISNDIFDLAEKKYAELLQEKKIDKIEKVVFISIDQKALDVFQKLSLKTFFIDHNEFLESLQSNSSLRKLNNEIKDFFQQNLPVELKKELYPLTGTPFNKSPDELNNLTNLQFKNYILDDMNTILKNGPDNQMLKYIIVGSLALVIPKIKEIYGDGFAFSFTI